MELTELTELTESTEIRNYNGVNYSTPKVFLLQHSGIGVAEVAARTCYDSFDKSNNDVVKDFPVAVESYELDSDNYDWGGYAKNLNKVEESGLLHDLAWAHHHHSILEHAIVQYYIEGTSRACYSDDTEVLTREGWKLFKHINKKDLFLTRNPDGSTKWEEATDFIAYHYKGPMHNYNGQSVDLLVTPNHRMMFKRNKSDVLNGKEDIHYCRSEDINFSRVRMLKQINYDGGGLLIPEISHKWEKKTKSGYTSRESKFICNNKEAFLKLLAAYISDGSTYYCSKENKFTVSISTPFKEKQVMIGEWCNLLGINTHKNKKDIRFNHMALGKWFKDMGLSVDKKFPFDPFDMTKEEARMFIDTYLIFDGSITKTGQGMLYTSSPYLKEDLYNIALIAGFTPNLHIVDKIGENVNIEGQDIEIKRLAYQIGISLVGKQNIEPTVYINKHKNSPFYRENKEYDGMVYCVSVPNTNLFVRRKDTGNAVWCGNCLQEHARHRIQAISVRSTRYTMSDILYAFVIAVETGNKKWFIDRIIELDMFVTTDNVYNRTLAGQIYDKLLFQHSVIGKNEFQKLCLTKENISNVLLENKTEDEMYQLLRNGKKKRNAGDSFKHIVDDNWKVDLVVSFNLRSLKNYLSLRSSGAAWFQINWLAEKMIDCTPTKYLKLIDKKYKDL